MIYERIQKGRFLKRPNRFIAKIEINGKEETVHVKNTGRCAELLVPGAEVYVQKSESAGRKMAKIPCLLPDATDDNIMVIPQNIIENIDKTR